MASILYHLQIRKKVLGESWKDMAVTHAITSILYRYHSLLNGDNPLITKAHFNTEEFEVRIRRIMSIDLDLNANLIDPDENEINIFMSNVKESK